MACGFDTLGCCPAVCEKLIEWEKKKRKKILEDKAEHRSLRLKGTLKFATRGQLTDGAGEWG